MAQTTNQNTINEDTIRQIAQLAKLTVTDAEVASYVPQIQKILNHFSELENLNTDAVEPLITPVEIKGYLRSDTVEKTISTEDLLENAPDKVGALFKVPPVI